MMRSRADAFFVVCEGSMLCNQRARLVDAALAGGADALLFIDSDMRFPADTIERLASRGKPVVGANCVQRSGRGTTAQRGGGLVALKRGVEQVDFIGFGVTLIQTSVLQALPRPHFAMPFDGEKCIGEDIFFCRLARENGFTVWADHDLGRLVRHIGTIEHGA